MKRLVSLAERLLNSFQSAFACVGMFTMVWMLMGVICPEETRIENAGIPVFFCMVVVHGVNKALAYLRDLLFDFELDEMLEIGSATEEDFKAAELFEHLEVK